MLLVEWAATLIAGAIAQFFLGVAYFLLTLLSGKHPNDNDTFKVALWPAGSMKDYPMLLRVLAGVVWATLLGLAWRAAFHEGRS